MATQWHNIGKVSEFPDEGKARYQLGEWHALVLKQGDDFFAFNDCCTHQASALSPGKVRRGTIMCPLHGARFKVETGECIGGAYPALKRFNVKITDDQIEVETPQDPPRPGEKPL